MFIKNEKLKIFFLNKINLKLLFEYFRNENINLVYNLKLISIQIQEVKKSKEIFTSKDEYVKIYLDRNFFSHMLRCLSIDKIPGVGSTFICD